MKPLQGLRIIELVGIGPGPYCGQLLADLGAEVVAIDRPATGFSGIAARGKKSVMLDLRKPGASNLILRLVATADALIEGNRPGVAERLGIGPEDCMAVNPRLVYGRMTGWGQTGPLASMAGHDINYLSITGALLAMGNEGELPPVPLNLLGDFGGGSLFLALGVVSALLRAKETGQGDIVDAAIVDGVASTMGVIHSLTARGQWTNKRHDNILDGGAPYYRCYMTADRKFMAVGAIEPKFFAALLEILGVDPETYGEQNDKRSWSRQHELLEKAFAAKTREEWTAVFEETDACVTPVLTYVEAPSHPHNAARGSHRTLQNVTHPHQAPRFASDEDWAPSSIPRPGAETLAVLRSAGVSDSEIQSLAESGAISGTDQH